MLLRDAIIIRIYYPLDTQQNTCSSGATCSDFLNGGGKILTIFLPRITFEERTTEAEDMQVSAGAVKSKLIRVGRWLQRRLSWMTELGDEIINRQHTTVNKD
jgi:hypothetical protein